MKSNDLFAVHTSSKRLNEALEKTFGKKLNLENFTLPQLEDARNKLRTQLSQIRTEKGFNENVESEAYAQAKFMLDAIVAEITEREEFIADAGTAEASYEEGFGSNARTGDTMKTSTGGTLTKTDKGIKHTAKPYKFTQADRSKRHNEFERPGDFEIRTKLHQPKRDFSRDSDGYDESIDKKENEMKKVTEGEIQQAQSIVTAKTMVDRVGRWIEELSGMENDTLLTLGDQIRDEMGQEQAKAFLTSVAPAIQQALDNLKTTRETLASGVRMLTGEEQPAEMLGAEPSSAESEPGIEAEPDMMNAEPAADLGDEFAAAEPAAGGAEAAGREQRESIQFQNRLLKVLAG